MTSILLAALIASSGVSRAADRARETAPAALPEQPGADLSDAELRHEIDGYLGTIDTPIPAAHWKALGPRAAPILAALISDAGQFPTRGERKFRFELVLSGDDQGVREIHRRHTHPH